MDLCVILINYNLLQHLRLFIKHSQFPRKISRNQKLNMLSVTTKLRNGESEHKLTHTLEFYESFTQVLLLSAFKNLTSVDEVPFIRFFAKCWTIPPTYRLGAKFVCL